MLFRGCAGPLTWLLSMAVTAVEQDTLAWSAYGGAPGGGQFSAPAPKGD